MELELNGSRTEGAVAPGVWVIGSRFRKDFVLNFVLRQIARFVLLMLAVSLVVFALVSASPVDPVQANVGQAAVIGMSDEKQAQLAAYWGADAPFWERYLSWLTALFQGDMGVLNR